MTVETAPKSLIEAAQIHQRIGAMAGEIVAALGDEFVMVVLLKGAFVFAADLLRALGQAGAHPRLEFLRLASYGLKKTSSGRVRQLSDLPAVAGQPVLLVDDVLDTGRTLAFATDILRQAGAGEIRLCVLLEKRSPRMVDLAADHVGFTIPDCFVVGFGIDYAEHWRELPSIATVD